MALIDCPDCKKAVSDTAKACPECGRPLNSFLDRPTGLKNWHFILFTVIAFSLPLFFGVAFFSWTHISSFFLLQVLIFLILYIVDQRLR